MVASEEYLDALRGNFYGVVCVQLALLCDDPDLDLKVEGRESTTILLSVKLEWRCC